MMPSVLLAGILFLLSLGLLVFICKSSFESKKIKKFYIAATAVYISGTALILILSIVISQLIVPHIIVMEGVILFVFVFDVIILRKIALGMDQLLIQAQENKENNKEDESED